MKQMNPCLIKLYYSSTTEENLFQKVSEKLIVKLNNIDEVNYLISKGIRYGYEGISHTTSRHSGTTYYLAESRDNMKILNEYRRSIIAK